MLKEKDILNTKQLVELLGSNKQKESYYKNGILQTNIKKSILKKLDSIAEYEEIRIANKKCFVINKLLNREESLNKRLKYARKFTLALDKKILSFLNYTQKDRLIITNKSIMRELDLVKEVFWELQGDHSNLKLVKDKNIDLQIARYYTGLLKSELNLVIEASLNRLNKSNKIKSKKTLIVSTNEGLHREATSEEKDKILNLQDDCLNKLNCLTIRGVVFIGAFKRYSKLIKKALLEYGLDYMDYFYYGHIISDIKNSEFITVKEKDILDKHLNNNIREMIYSRCLNRRVKQMENSNNGFGEELFTRIEVKENFLSEIEKLIEYTLKGE
ncbi:hypothetical protein UT300003_32050 [Clostridium sardiniense]